MDQTPRHMRIGEVADVLRINPKTIRYYEDIDLLPQPARSANGYRCYTPETSTCVLHLPSGIMRCVRAGDDPSVDETGAA